MHQYRLVVSVFVLLLFVTAGCAPSAAAPPAASTTSATMTAAASPTTLVATPSVALPSNTPPSAAVTPTPALSVTTAATQAAVSAATASVPPGTAQQRVVVDMKNYAFVPKSITVAPGTTVVWRNDDGTTHTVTADNKLFDSGDMNQGAEFTHVFTEPGVYPYYCVWHGGPRGQGMSGTVTVK